VQSQWRLRRKSNHAPNVRELSTTVIRSLYALRLPRECRQQNRRKGDEEPRGSRAITAVNYCAPSWTRGR
jgi:hypothetical protein